METRSPLIVSGCLIAGMLAISAWAWPDLPETARIATHFDIRGHANGYMGKTAALFFAPGMAGLITLVMALLPHFISQKENLAQSATAYVTGWLGVLVILFIAHCGVILLARGYKFDIAGTSVLVASMLFVMLGNVLGKTRPNSVVGVRTPWTKKSDLSWDKSNRLGGRLLVASGLANLATLAVAGTIAAHIVLLGGILALAAICTVMSYVYWQQDPNRQA